MHSSHEFQHAVVIVDAVERRDTRIIPAVILQQFSAMSGKTPEIRVYGVGHPAVKAIRPCHLGIEIEGHVIPVRVMKQRVFQILAFARKRLGEHPPNEVTPTQFASQCITGEDLLLGLRIN